MAKKEKYYLESRIVFPNEFNSKEFLKEFEFNPYIHILEENNDSHFAKKDGLFGNNYSRQQLKRYSDLSIYMIFYGEECKKGIIKATGSKQKLEEVENYLDSCYEQNKFVTMNYYDTIDEQEKKDSSAWITEQKYRLHLYETGKSIEEIRKIIEKEKEEQDEKTWLEGIPYKNKILSKETELKELLNDFKIMRKKISETRNELNELKKEDEKTKVKVKTR